MIDSQRIAQALREFDRERDWEQFHSPKNVAMSIAVEAAELMELFQWSRGEKDWQDANASDVKGRVAEECADVLLNLIRFADKAGIDLQKAALAKLHVNARRYPVATSKGCDKKYTEKT